MKCTSSALAVTVSSGFTVAINNDLVKTRHAVCRIMYKMNATFLKRLPIGRELLIRFTVCSVCVLTYCDFVVSHFGFEGGTLVLIASVPGHCLSFTLLLLLLLLL